MDNIQKALSVAKNAHSNAEMVLSKLTNEMSVAQFQSKQLKMENSHLNNTIACLENMQLCTQQLEAQLAQKQDVLEICTPSE